MGRYAKEPTGGNFEDVAPGTYLGICYRVIDLGTQRDEFNGEERVRSQVMISWELPGELMNDGRPFSVSRFYTNSLHEKAALRRDLISWRGRDFTPAELERFDLASIIGVAALVSVIHNDKGRARIAAVLKPPKGSTAPAPFNPLLTFFIDEWDDAVFAQIPKGIQDIINRSDERQGHKNDDISFETTEF